MLCGIRLFESIYRGHMQWIAQSIAAEAVSAK
jgi:hypothetical protein